MRDHREVTILAMKESLVDVGPHIRCGGQVVTGRGEKEGREGGGRGRINR